MAHRTPSRDRLALPQFDDVSPNGDMHSVLLIGLGDVGMGYDMATSGMAMKSHASAYFRHPRFKLAAAVDTNAKARSEFERKFRIPSFETVTEAFALGTYDVVVVASPTSVHLANIVEVLECFTPKVILCEKPLSYEIASALQIVKECRVRGVKLFVNYHRRVDAAVSKVRKMIANNEMEPPFHGTVEISKGLIHNGTHFLDLLAFWFGRVTEFQAVSNVIPLGEEDGLIDLYLAFSSGSLAFLTNGVAPNVADITLEFENGSLHYFRGGRSAKWRPAGKGKRTTTRASEEVDLGPRLDTCQYFVAEAIFSEIQGYPSDLCTGEEGVEVLELALTMLGKGALL